MMGRENQRQRILTLLRAARGRWVPLPEILALGVAQYGARIWELRRAGFNVENRCEHVGHTRHSWFRIAESPASDCLKSPEMVEKELAACQFLQLLADK